MVNLEAYISEVEFTIGIVKNQLGEFHWSHQVQSPVEALVNVPLDLMKLSQCPSCGL